MYTYVNWFSRNGVHTIMNPNKIEKMDMMRMKDIISQLTDVIYLLCDAKDTNITMIMEQFTNLTCEERDRLHYSVQIYSQLAVILFRNSEDPIALRRRISHGFAIIKYSP